MKALKINTKIQLPSDLSVIANAIVLITDSRVKQINRYEDNGQYFYPSSIVFSFYQSVTAIQNGAAPLGDIVEVPQRALNVNINTNTYEKISTEDYTIAIARDYLETIFPGVIEEIII